MNEQVKYWQELAEYDLETAKVMLKSGRYLYVGFMCHQVIEKILKAYFAQQKNEIPPRSHNLESISNKTDLITILSQDQLYFIRSLEPMNVESRYPSDRELLAKALTESKCRTVLEQTTELYQWINQKLSE